jgi:signal transduction histidine kinase
MKKKKPYNTSSKYNPAFQARQISKIQEQLSELQKQNEAHKLNIAAISKSHDVHISFLANFARHDIKNTIQNIDSILSTTSPNEYNSAHIESLVAYLNIIRSTIDNFAKLVPYSVTGKFTLTNLMVAVELLGRTEMHRNDIDIIFDYPRDSSTEIDLPFQVMLQMMNNLLINSIKSLENVTEKKMFIGASLEGGFVCFQIKDNGTVIEDENKVKIFSYGYSTTGGSGIGLFHAKYLCKEFKGEITVDLGQEDKYNKKFSIKMPLSLTSDGKDSPDN